MARITVEDCLTVENNRFSLVQLASKRTKQILTGATVQVSETKNKAVVTALREIAAGKVRFMTPQEAIAFEENRQREIEAAKAAGEAERSRRRDDIGAGIFNNGETRTPAFLRDALLGTGVPAGDSSDDEE